MAEMTGASSSSSGLIVSNSKAIRSFLQLASVDPSLPEPLRDTAVALCSQSSVPYKSLRSLWSASDPSTRPSLCLIFRGASFIFTSPKPRQKSEELKARLRKLEELAERNSYAELIKDIVPKGTHEPFSSYKDQLGFGLHVLVTMFTGYLVGYAAFRALFSHNPVMNVAGGILGLVFAMLVETLLFIIKSSDFTPKSKLQSGISKLKKDQ
ncbi:hypothetical protein Nepgr_030649 [Nepenthes gracilis]|uniref:Uncharacterized protein n=1 Tax=Nepenthes gracilis TaxID=150966 RepID=A0AAD3TH21_NEPGR|nr:hypothetical protein Nepgr_030649 [Nepenthes gracilis]